MIENYVFVISFCCYSIRTTEQKNYGANEA